MPLVLTAQERVILGATPPTDTELGTPADWYRPQGVLKQELSLEEVIDRRRELGDYITSAIMESVLGVGKPIVLELAKIDPETGQTLEDPKIIGLWDKETKTVIKPDEGSRLTREVYKVFRASGYDLHLRSQSHNIESGGLRGAEHE